MQHKYALTTSNYNRRVAATAFAALYNGSTHGKLPDDSK